MNFKLKFNDKIKKRSSHLERKTLHHDRVGVILPDPIDGAENRSKQSTPTVFMCRFICCQTVSATWTYVAPTVFFSTIKETKHKYCNISCQTHYLWVMSTFLNLVLQLTGSESSLEQNIFSLQSLVVCRQLKASYTSPALCHLLLSVSAHLDLSSLLFSVSRSLSPPSIYSQQQLAQPTGRPTAADRFDTDVMTCHGLRRKADNWFPFFSFSSCISLQNPNSSLLRSRLFVYVIFHQEVSRAADYSPPTLIGGKGCAD